MSGWKHPISLLANASLLFSFISLLTPWTLYSAGTPSQTIMGTTIPGTDNSGGFYLSYSYACVATQGTLTASQNRKTCSQTMVGDFATALNAIAPALIVGLTFTLISFFASCVNQWVVYKHVRSTDGVFYKPHVWITFLVSTIASVIAYSTYAGIMTPSSTLIPYGATVGFAGGNPSYTLGPGFAMSILTFLSSLGGIVATRKMTVGTQALPTIRKNPVTGIQ